MARVEIKNEKDLERWLNSLPEDQRRQVATTIACRTALRVLPVVERWLRAEEGKAISVVLPTVRATCASWTAQAWANYNEELLKAADAAADTAYDACTYADAAAAAVAAVTADITHAAAAIDAAANATTAIADPSDYDAVTFTVDATVSAAYAAYASWGASR